ncbi:MAG: PKD domain-containing protein [Phaeodactylibacter sp.]|uniref:PKD domain-containing protein n=1 Tax=Phaeodactylibacter sp. TaxID=1940289 RepID=UPI0032EDAE52
MHCYKILIFTIIGLFSYLPIFSQNGTNAAHTEANGSGGSVSATLGQIFYVTGDACGGRVQAGVLQPDFPLLTRESRLDATDTSDAYITISWSVLEECFKDVGNRCMPYPDGVLLELLAGGERIYSDIIFNANGLLTDSYRHFVGPDSTVNYTLNLFIRGSGAMACTSISTMGSTLPFQPPTNLTASTGASPGEVTLSWTNNSQLTSSVLVFRKTGTDSVLVEAIPGTETVDTSFTFVDAYITGNPDNLVNGQVYEYCLATFNDQLDRTLPEQVCTNGSTFDIGLGAMVEDNSIVNLSWNDVSSFASALNIRRDGIVIATLDSTSTAFTDQTPTFGMPSSYQLDLLNEEGQTRGRDVFTVDLDAIGQISGFIRTPLSVGIADIPVTYSVRIEADTLRDTVYTDYRGFYVFDQVFFGRRGVFNVNARDMGRFTFSNRALRDTLTNGEPISSLLNFTSRETYPTSIDGSIIVDTVIATAGIDELSFQWDYQTSDNLRDTIHFQLFRESQLIDFTDDQQSQPFTLMDESGSAGYIYQYRVVAYGFKGDSLVSGSKMLFDTMPAVESPYNLVGQVGIDANSDNVMALSWDHDSENFDGFRLYRDNELIAILDTASRTYYDYYADPGQTFTYELTAFRKAAESNDILESSPPANSGPLSIPDLPVAISLTADPLPASNAVELSWSLPATADNYDNLSGFIVSRNGVPVKRILKEGQNYIYRDYQGGSDINYTYSVSPYLYVPDTTYVGTATTAAVTYPVVAEPGISTVTQPAPGVLGVNVDPAYAQQYSNFDGYVLSVNGVRFDTLRPFEFSAFLTPNVAGGLTNIDIELAAFRTVNGVEYTSDIATQTASIPAQTGAPLDSIEHFTASNDIPMHVGLKWEFPDFIFATFSVYRDGVLLDTLPFTARNYYDYGATPGQKHLYTLTAEYEGTSSPVVAASGLRRGTDFLHGQLLAKRYTTDRNGVSVSLVDASTNAFLQGTTTDSSGYFRFARLHELVGSGDWEIAVDDIGGGHELVANSQSGLTTSRRTILFRDDFSPAVLPPLPYQDSIAFVTAFQLSPFEEEQAMVASWSFTEGAATGAVLDRGLSEIVSVRMNGRQFFMDTLGVGATTYPYLVGPYVLQDGNRIPEAEVRTVFRNTDYPALPAVECLSALPNLNYLDNSITLQWSHFNDKVSFYEIRRNGLPLGTVSPGDSLWYVDVQGKPNQTYIYEVRAVRTNNIGVSNSDFRSVEVVFPTVARPAPFSAVAEPDSNAVRLDWSYNGSAVSAFRIFRNDVPIADVPADERSYRDYEGIPFSEPTYSIVALLEREGILFQSRASEAEVEYPPILSPFNVVATPNTNLGLTEISFNYRAQGVSQFIVYRVSGGNRTELGNIPYTYDGTLQSFAFSDNTGVKDASYRYELVATDRREGILYESAPGISNLAVYPPPPPVDEFFATTDLPNWVDLDWAQDLGVNVDGFRIERTFNSFQDTFFVFNPGKRTYRDVFFPFPNLPNTNMQYVIRSYRNVEGATYFSIPRNINGRVANIANNTALSQVIASKGTFTNRTRISWEYTGDIADVDNFLVYRDEEQIATLGADDSFYNDSDGVPGREYVYVVSAVVNGNEDSGLSDIGFTKGAGQLEGEVVSLIGNAPIQGAYLVARGIVEGELYTYEAYTDENGQFIISGMYVGEEPVNYTLSVSFRDHVFVESEQTFTLSPQNSTRSNIFFLDSTAYTVAGSVSYAGSDCSIDSITVRALHILSDGNIVEETTTTGADGTYGLVLNPYLNGLVRIEITIDSVYTRNLGMPGEERILHRFANPVRQVSTPVPQFTEFNFQDVLTYDVAVSVRNVCGFAASSNARFDIEVSTRDGCFKRIEQTALNGKVTLQLPPLDGIVARVVGAAPLSLENNLIVNYLEYRPTELELGTFHIANTELEAGGLVQIQTDTTLERTLVYHKPASITLASEFGMRPACNPNQPRILQQNSRYTTRFNVTELHQGVVCDVKEGYIIINNSAAKENSRDTLFYQPETDDFEQHSFRGGAPNLVAPYRKGINIQYFSEIGDLLAERTIPVIVLGASPLPGSDIIVDVEDEEGQVKMPIYILRDPPGDGSFSSIEEGQTFTKSLTDVFSFRGGAGLDLDFKLGLAGQGLFLEIEQRIGGSTNDEDTFELEFTTKQTISTSSTADFVGPDADVMVGIGVAIQYGLIDEIRFNEETCSITKVQSFNVSPNEIKTDWNYTVGQIKQIANERRAQADSVRAGSLEIQVGGNILPPGEAEERLITEAMNWEEILNYHQVESVPFYQFCAETYDPDQLWSEVQFYNLESEYRQGLGVFGQEVEFSDAEAPSDYRDRVVAADAARRIFCADPAVGSYNAQDSFILAQDIQEVIFTTDLAAKYETATRAVDYYLDSLYIPSFLIESFIGQTPTVSFIPTVENTTFSAGVDIEKSKSISQTTSSKFSQRGFFTLSASVGALLGVNTEAGFGIIIESIDIENKIGVGLDLEFEWGKDFYSSSEVESTVSYTFSDDDPGDQFSITAIQARDPGHTPYFQLLGGRSSCPPEVGTILRDRFDISLYDPETQSTFDFQELRALNPDEPAIFYLQLTNLNPFGEQRDFFVYHEAESNENGAALRLNGAPLGGGNQTGQTLTFINANQPVIIPLELNRSINNYQFDSIFITLRPSCTDGDLFLLGVRDTVTISAFFDSPCSDISIASPGNDWLITRRNPFQADSREAIVVEVGDYDSENPNLDEIYLEYRRIGDGSGWEIVPFTELEPRYIVNQDSLIQYDMEKFGPGESPRFFFTWDITELYQKYPDGTYEIRAIAACGTDGVTQSNLIRGQIRRQTGEAFALFEPSDLVWQSGDEISIKVNRELDCATLTEASFIVMNEATRDTVPGTFGCDPAENKLVFLPFAPSSLFETLEPFDDQLLTIKVSGLRDEFGNPFPLLRNAQGIVQETLDANGNTVPARDTFKWDFRVVARDILVQDTFLETTIYQDSEGILRTVLFNTNQGAGATIGFSIPELLGLPWLQATPPNGIITTSDGLPVQFNIDGSLLPVGDTTVVLSVVSNSVLNNAGVDNIRIKVNVLARPPYWVVDPADFSNSMQVVTNYQYTQPPGNAPSRDTMDIISAWIGNEIRGVARIASTQTGQYAAFMLVYGNPEDIGKPIEFRAWDADPGEEYNAYPLDSIFFDETTLVGSFSDPELLFADRDRDRARYIPVNGEGDGGGGLTWLSFNSQETDMTVNEQLRELKFLENGDIIKTESTSAGYVEGVGWISTNGLDSIDVEEGYILFLGNLDDTIRVTGRDATYGPIVLEQGWNIIGYPLQDTVGINDAFTLFNVEDGDRMQTVPQDPIALDLPTNMIAEYNETLMRWLFAPGMEVLRPNFAYQILVSNPAATMLYDGAQTPFTEAPVSDGMGSNLPVFAPSDPETWTVDPSAYPSSMVVTSTLHFDGEMSLDEGDRVAAYVNGACRGVAPVSYVEALDAYRAPLFVYGTQAGDEVQFLMYDASAGQVFLAEASLLFEPNGITGSFTAPYAMEARSMSAAYEQSGTYCAADANGTISVAMVTGLEAPYTYQWETGAESAMIEGLTAGDYSLTITGANGLVFADTVTLENLNIEIPAPEIELSAQSPACRGTDVVLYAHAPNTGASVLWETADGELLQENPALLIEDIQSAYTARAKTTYRGCLSEPSEIVVEVYQPDASFTLARPTELTTETEVQFTPAETEGSFAWAFGDGESSTLMNPMHQYELPGHYQTVLSLTDMDGCTGQGLYDIWVSAATQVLELPEGELLLQANPNPFGTHIDVSLQLPYGSRYTLELLTLSGQRIEKHENVWEAGAQSLRLSPDVPDGTYLLRLESSRGHQLALPIVKQTPRP